MTEWYDKEPGHYAQRPSDDGHTELLMGVPDKVRLPFQLGGHVEPVHSMFRDYCVHPECDRVCKHYVLETVKVCECVEHDFQWYRTTRTMECQGEEE